MQRHRIRDTVRGLFLIHMKKTMNNKSNSFAPSNALLTDLYQLTMMNGYFLSGIHDKVAVFDVYYRPQDVLHYSVFSGLQQVIEYIEHLHFEDGDIEYLRSLGIFDERFLMALSTLKFEGDIYSVVEGEVIFPNTPLMIVKAPLWQAQLVETAILNILGHQCLVATRASRMVQACQPHQTVIEYGLRRAHGNSAAIYASRAACIAGCVGTSNVYAGKLFDLAVKGTHAHAWIQSHNSELEAFRTYAKIYPKQCLLLIDTYDTLKSGLKNAITVFKELREAGHEPIGIRVDSGDFAYLSKQIRKELDAAGFEKAIILVSGDIDENIIESLNSQGAKIDAWGIGGKLVTGHPSPVFGLVYKLASIQSDDRQTMIPKLKISNDSIKTSNPGIKNLYRIYDQDEKAFADLTTLENETLATPLVLTHPVERYKFTTMHTYTARNLHTQIYKKGKLVYSVPSVAQSALYLKAELNKFWDEYKRIYAPQVYKINLSDDLYELKNRLINMANNGGYYVVETL